MKALLGLIGLSMSFLLLSCSKSVEKPENPAIVTASSTSVLLVDPVACPPSNYQNNSKAFQYNYARTKIIKSMNGQLPNATPDVVSSNIWHVYLRADNGKYYHLPGFSPARIAYSYSVKSASPQSSITISRGAGVEETFETIIVIGVKASYIASLNTPINFDDYASVKNKLGF
jgi:hypothetical protein